MPSLENPEIEIQQHQQNRQKLSRLEQRRKKYNTNWKQQTLWAIRHRVTVLHSLIYFLVFGIIFIVIGCFCYVYASRYPPAIRVDYTDCLDKVTNQICSADPANYRTKMCKCEVEVVIDNDKLIQSEGIILYYELTYFYQNIRTYKKDFDEDQLEGKAIKGGKAVPPPSRQCLKWYRESDYGKKYIFPCGKMANSYFSDVFKVFDSSKKEVFLDTLDIAWGSDKKLRFKKPKIKDWSEITNYFDLPKDWHEEQKTIFKQNNGTENEHFIVWMRAAALKTFRKKYAYLRGLANGTYTIQIDYRFDSKSYGGRKRIVIAADPQDLPVDYFFFQAYTAIGVFCLLIGPAVYLSEYAARVAHKRRLKRDGSSNCPNQKAGRHEIESQTQPQGELLQTNASHGTLKSAPIDSSIEII